MSAGKARAIAYGVVALFGVAAVVLTDPLPRAASARAMDVLQRDSRWRERHDTLGPRETLVGVLGRSGLSVASALEALRHVEPRTVRTGMAVRTRGAAGDSVPTEIALRLAVDRVLHIRRGDRGWTAEEEQLPWDTDTITVTGTVTSHLYAAMDAAAGDLLNRGQRERLTEALANLYEFRVDMNRDLRVGDRFTVVAERLTGPENTVRAGQILAASMTLSGTTVDAVRFKSALVPGEFFDAEGRPLRSGFLRMPIQFGRMTSRFGMRRHPILGTMRQHQGTDYGAAAGTPIRTVGDGVIIKAGWGNGYGNVVEVRHPNGFVTRYGHMRGFAKGITRGKRVAVGSTIGYVGSTGLSTAPHLHFEVLVKGVHRDPRLALRNASSDPIPQKERRAFAEARSMAQELLRQPTRLASADTARRVAEQ